MGLRPASDEAARPSAPSTALRSPSPVNGGGEWAAMLRVAALRLGIAPEAFWRLSLSEWRMLTEDAGPAAMGRSELERLMREHPDR